VPFQVPPPPQIEYGQFFAVQRRDSKHRCVFDSEAEASVEVDAQRVRGHKTRITKVWMTRKTYNNLPEFHGW
jgi:hypothetical protein